MNKSDEILEKISKKTPVWAIGITTLIVAATSSLVTIYVVAKDDIRDHFKWVAQSTDAQNARRDAQETKALEAIMVTVSSNAERLADLSKQLVDAKIEASTLTARVADLERAVDRLKMSLTSCQDSLKLCLEGKKP